MLGVPPGGLLLLRVLTPREPQELGRERLAALPGEAPAEFSPAAVFQTK